MITFSSKVEEVMNSAVSIIQTAGVSENAAKIYTALLRIGKGNYSSLAAATGLHPQSVKNGLRELTERRFVIRLDHKLAQTLWRPVPPFEISKRLRSTYESFTQALPGLQGLYRQHPATHVRVSAGFNEVITHIRDHVEKLRRGRRLAFIGSTWQLVERELADDWRELQSAAARRGLVWRAQPLRKRSEGPMAFAVSEKRITIFIYDPTGSIVVSIDERRSAKQMAALLV